MSRGSLQRRRRGLAVAGAAALTVVLGAVAATVLVDRRAAAVRDRPLVDAPPERIVVRRPGFADIVLAHAADDDGPGRAWRIEAPCALAAVDARVAPLLEALAATRLTRDAADIDLAGAGLAPPVATLVLDGRRIDVGGPDLGGERRYVLRGDAVGFAPEWLGSLLGGGLSAFAAAPVVDGRVVAADGDAGAAAAWSALEAVQTVDWPLADPAGPIRERTVALRLADGTVRSVEVASTDAWHAIRAPGAGCARIVGLDALPD